MAADDSDVFVQIAKLAKVEPEQTGSFQRALRSIVASHAPHGEGAGREKAPPLLRADIVDPLSKIAAAARKLKHAASGLDNYGHDAPPWAVFVQGKLASIGMDGEQLIAALEIMGCADVAVRKFKTPQAGAHAAFLLLVKRLLDSAAEHGGRLTFSVKGEIAKGPLVDALHLLRPLIAASTFPVAAGGADYLNTRGCALILEEARKTVNEERRRP